ncbi:MAG: hypothetical protein IKL52_06325, partial [Candidatus Gastranaerophilales bacterium]|nr:hypothetical protein [Candidatus Gastranaerophilales bacterium]
MINLIKQENKNADNKILIIGVFHGDEPQGEFFINSYFEKSQSSGKNSLYFIPKLNPSGVRKNSNGVDLNRNFPTKNWELGDINSDYFGGIAPNSEIETKYLVDLIEKNNFRAIITIHAPYKTINYDGPAEILAQKISDIIGYPPSSDIGYATPGSFGTYCGKERQIPTITIEIDEEENLEILNQKFQKLFD